MDSYLGLRVNAQSCVAHPERSPVVVSGRVLKAEQAQLERTLNWELKMFQIK